MIDISKLIEVAEEISEDDQIGFAAKVQAPVQVLEINGHQCQLSLLIEVIKDKP